jgi:DNA-binding SARP family transcriptional activator
MLVFGGPGEARMAKLTFRVLGPVEVLSDGEPVALRRAGVLPVLAGLLLDANRLVGTDQLIRYAWNGTPPPSVRAALHNRMSILRRVVGEGVIETLPGGYRLRATPQTLDLLRFDELAAQAGRADDDEAAGLWAEALGLWQQPLLGNVGSDRLLDSEVVQLTERYLGAQEKYGEVCLRLGRHGALAEQLTSVLQRHPLRERLVGKLMLALFHAGRQADALAAYHRTRQLLDDELGIPPGRELRDLYLRMLKAHDGRGSARNAAPRTVDDGASTVRKGRPDQPPDPTVQVRAEPPCQLPPDTGDLTGRSQETEALRHELTAAGTTPGTARTVALTGQGGIGKTALAVHVAHAVATNYPDGQLFVDLQGYGGVARDPADVLAGFLRALGVVGAVQPDDHRERALLYRSLLARRRMLVVLDNAEDEAQVEALLPASALCGVVLTSRRRLAALVGVRHVELDALPVEDAVEFLRRAVDPVRVLAEPRAARALAELCGGLPIALRIAAARLVARPHWRIDDLTRRLREARHPLNELSHAGLDVRASITLSYDALTDDARRVFRRVGLLDAPDFPAWAGAALLDVEVAQAQDLLEQLVDARLLQVSSAVPPERFRYRLHDLVRNYARERACAQETRQERDSALARAFGGWLALAEEAHRAVYGGDYTIMHGPARRWTAAARPFATAGEALSWLDRERLAIRAAITQAPEVGANDLCWDLAWTATTLYEAFCYYDDWRATAGIALDVATRTGDRRGRAAMLRSLASLYSQTGHVDEVEALCTEAADIFRSLGDTHGFALARHGLGVTAQRREAPATAARIFGETLDLFRGAGDRYMEATALRALAQTRLAQSDDRAAEDRVCAALPIFRELGGGRGRAQAMQVLGEIRLHQRRFGEAEELFRRLLDLLRDSSERYGQTYALTGLGEALSAQRKDATAEETLNQALALARRYEARLLEGRDLLALGELRLHRGAPDAAALLEQSIAIFERCTAAEWHSRATRCLNLARRSPSGVGTGSVESHHGVN